MAYLGVYGGIAIVLISLGSIIKLLRNKGKRLSLIIVTVLIIIIPFWLNAIIYKGWYKVIPVESSLEPKEWMAFLGSYFSVVGTVIIGALAYWQTEVNRQQDLRITEQNNTIEELQNKIAAYQVKPVIYFKRGKIKTYTGKQNKYNNEELYKNLYYMMYNAECSSNEESFIHIVIPYVEKNIVPIEEIKIVELVWEIDSIPYKVDLSKTKYTLTGNKLQILLDKNVEIKDNSDEKKTGDKLIQQAACHQSYFSNGVIGLANSQLEMKVSITNQMKKSREYSLRYQICSEYEGKKLLLKNPHIKITDGE